MRKETKTYIFFDEKDRKSFKKWLIDNDLTLGEIADKLFISNSYINCILAGTRAVTDKVREGLNNLGFKI